LDWTEPLRGESIPLIYEEMAPLSINFDYIADIPMRGVRRASVFLGLGVNAARNPQFKDYQLQNLALFRIMPDALPDETIAHFKENFEEWVISCALRELTETLDVFLDSVHRACLLMATNQGTVTPEEANKWGPVFERGGLDSKLSLLRRRFSIETSREAYFKGIKQARHCIAHRRGIVGMEDVDESDNKLHLQWWRVELLIKTPIGKEISLMPPLEEGAIVLEEGGEVQARFSTNERVFAIGQKISLNPNDLTEVCLLVKLASADIVKGLIEYTKSLRVEIQQKDTEQAPSNR
jgi:hypothetical protein